MALVRRTTNYYDLIVLGSDLAGLVAAAVVAVRGRRVLLIPDGPLDGLQRSGRVEFPLDPTPLMWLRGVVARPLVEEAGIWSQLRRDYRTRARKVDWIGHGRRFDVSTPGPNVTADSAWQDALRRYGEASSVLEAARTRNRVAAAGEEILDELLRGEAATVLDGFWTRKFSLRVDAKRPLEAIHCLPGLDDNHPLRWTLNGLDPFYQSLAVRNRGLSVSLRQWQQWHLGPADLQDCEASLRRALLARIQLKSGEIRPQLRASEIIIRRGRATGVSLLGKPDSYGCENLLIARDPQTLLHSEYFDANLLPVPVRTILERVKPVARRFVLHFEIADRGIPEQLGEYAIVAPDAAGTDIGAMFISRQAGTMSGCQRITVSTIVAESESYIDQREKILESLEARAILPFVRAHIRLIHSPHDGRPATDGNGNRIALGMDERDTPTIAPAALYESPATATGLGVAVLPHSTGIRNLYFGSDRTYPGLGREGQLLAGLAVANAAAPTLRPSFSRAIFGRNQ